MKTANDPTPKLAKILFGIGVLVFFPIWRFIWISPYSAATVFGCLVAGLLVQFYSKHAVYDKIKSLLLSIGATCNAVAIVVNHGYMPALVGYRYGVWSNINVTTRLKVLCDIHPLGPIGYFSVGDVIIGIEVLLSIVIWLVQN